VDKFVDLLLKAWEKAGAPLWDSIWFWRITALIALSGIVAAWLKRKWIIGWFTYDKFLAHDRKKFAKADVILPEQFTNDALSYLGANASLADDDLNQLTKFCSFFSLEENQFLIPTLKKASSEAVNRLVNVTDFMAHHFFPLNHRPDHYFLYPDLKNSDDPKKREIFAKSYDLFVDHVRKAQIAYKSYRRIVKKILLV
jgi:hypothetical protein